MAGHMCEIGLETELTTLGMRGGSNAVGRWRGSGGGLMFNGHLDSNPVTDGLTVDPWAGKVDDAFSYGTASPT
jgi:acetylornithine deacetylase